MLSYLSATLTITKMRGFETVQVKDEKNHFKIKVLATLQSCGQQRGGGEALLHRSVDHGTRKGPGALD